MRDLIFLHTNLIPMFFSVGLGLGLAVKVSCRVAHDEIFKYLFNMSQILWSLLGVKKASPPLHMMGSLFLTVMIKWS